MSCGKQRAGIAPCSGDAGAALELSCEIHGGAVCARGGAALLLACMPPHQRKHCSQLCLQSRRASPELAEAAAHICSGGHTSCTAVTLLLLIYSPAFFFFFPLHPLADRFPSDGTSPWLSPLVLFPLLSSRPCTGVGWGLSLPEGHCFVPTRCAEFLTLAPSEQPPASSWPCCNLDSHPFASPCSWFILLVFNVGFASLEKGYNHLGNTWRADLLSFLLPFFLTPWEQAPVMVCGSLQFPC